MDKGKINQKESSNENLIQNENNSVNLFGLREIKENEEDKKKEELEKEEEKKKEEEYRKDMSDYKQAFSSELKKSTGKHDGIVLEQEEGNDILAGISSIKRERDSNSHSSESK